MEVLSTILEAYYVLFQKVHFVCRIQNSQAMSQSYSVSKIKMGLFHHSSSGLKICIISKKKDWNFFHAIIYLNYLKEQRLCV